MAQASERGAVRMGPVSIFALVVVLCLAVLSVLAVATARANLNEVNRQAGYTRSSYSNEFVGQTFLGEVDAVLARTAAQGGTPEDALEALGGELPAAASIEGRGISLAFMTSDGRTLVIVLSVNDDLTYNIEQWKTVTQWQPEPSVGELWDGR